jgi:hypothetical protein
MLLPSPRFALRSVALMSLLGLTACFGGSNYVRVLTVNPPDASVYINGERVGQGSSRPQTFSFADCTRIYVQATHPDYQPETEWFTIEKMDNMVATNTDVKLTLRSR